MLYSEEFIHELYTDLFLEGRLFTAYDQFEVEA